VEELEKDRESFRWFTLAWDDYVGALPVLIPVVLTQALASAGSFYIIHRWHSLPAAAAYMLLVVTPLATGLNLVYIKIARGSGARYADLFGAFPVYHRAVAVSVLLSLAAMGGALLLIIPGIIIYLTFIFSEYAVVDRRTGVRESFRLSAAITYGWKTRLFPVFTLALLITAMVPDIYVVTGPFKTPSASLALKPWTVAAAALKTFVFLPWIGLALARAYNLLLAQPAPEPRQPQADA